MQDAPPSLPAALMARILRLSCDKRNFVVNKAVNQDLFGGPKDVTDVMVRVHGGLRRALQAACRSFAAPPAVQLAVCRELIHRGARVVVRGGGDKDELLLDPIDHGRAELCALLMRHGARADVTCDAGDFHWMFDVEDGPDGGDHLRVQRALVRAAYWGAKDVCEVLLSAKRGAARANAGRSFALSVAAARGHRDVCRLLLTWPTRPALASHGHALVYALKRVPPSDLTTAMFLLMEHDGDAERALLEIPAPESFDVARLLVEHGADHAEFVAFVHAPIRDELDRSGTLERIFHIDPDDEELLDVRFASFMHAFTNHVRVQKGLNPR